MDNGIKESEIDDGLVIEFEREPFGDAVHVSFSEPLTKLSLNVRVEIEEDAPGYTVASSPVVLHCDDFQRISAIGGSLTCRLCGNTVGTLCFGRKSTAEAFINAINKAATDIQKDRNTSGNP